MIAIEQRARSGMVASRCEVTRDVIESLRGREDVDRVLASLTDEDEVDDELGGCSSDLIVGGEEVSKSSQTLLDVAVDVADVREGGEDGS